MSICRRVETGGIYIYEMCAGAQPFHCQACSISARREGDWFGRTRWHVILHLLRHKWRDGNMVRIWPGLRGAWYRT